MSEKDELAAEIADTRDRMSDTLDELGVRLNPNRIKEQVRENIREATIGRVENMARQAGERVNETRDGILNTIRDNPVPAAMIGIGLGWLILGGRRRSGEHHGSHESHIHSEAGYVGDISATTPRLIQDDAAGGMGGSISHDHGNGVVNRLREHVSDVGERVADVRASVATRASTFVAGTSTRVSNASHTLQDTPLALGAVALAAGLAAGLAIPSSEREAEMMGDQRDRLIDRAREAATDVKERARNVAERVINETRDNVRDTVKEVARDEGLSSGGPDDLSI
ncbi:MAG TPA: DUF3618 domain-containing protein [Longimicrobiales bacterium]|nr:DUF3618 domain-containing protein [Longimicrobiales bacterium]